MNSLIEINNITFEYNKNNPVIMDLSLYIDKKDFIGIIGPNGGGKSTLLKLLIGELPIQKGAILIDGKKVSPKNFPYNDFAYVPQIDNYNMLLPLQVHEFISLGAINAPSPLSINQIIELTELKGLENRLITELSGGQKKRAILAKAMIKNPKILVLDEPTNTLDTQGVDQLVRTIKKLIHEHNITVIMVDHNINQLMKHASKILCLNVTGHFHDYKETLPQHILKSTYHCEFEHILIHENISNNHDHHHCTEHLPNEKKDNE